MLLVSSPVSVSAADEDWLGDKSGVHSAATGICMSTVGYMGGRNGNGERSSRLDAMD